MNRIFSVIFFLLASGNLLASDLIKSCDGEFTAALKTKTTVLIKSKGKPVGYAKIDHQLDGGVFSLDNSFFVAYGIPNVVDRRYPQVRKLTIYSIKKSPAIVFMDVYGGGIFSAKFSADGENLVVDHRYGTSIIDVKMRKLRNFDLSREVTVPLQECVSENSAR